MRERAKPLRASRARGPCIPVVVKGFRAFRSGCALFAHILLKILLHIFYLKMLDPPLWSIRDIEICCWSSSLTNVLYGGKIRKEQLENKTIKVTRIQLKSHSIVLVDSYEFPSLFQKLQHSHSRHQKTASNLLRINSKGKLRFNKIWPL